MNTIVGKGYRHQLVEDAQPVGEKCPLCKGRGHLLLKGANYRQITCMTCKGSGEAR